MAVNDWRLSGGLGHGEVDEVISPDQPVMLQGIGYPLRPIDNVPGTTSPTIPEDAIAEGLFMSWMGTWSAGQFYPKGSYVRAGLFTAIANKITLQNPEPQPTEAPSFFMPTPWNTGVTQNNISTIECTHIVTFVESGWVKKIRIWVPAVGANIEYEVIIVDNADPTNPITVRIPTPTVAAGDWATVTFLNTIIPAGTEFRFILAALNSSATTSIDGGWTYQGTTQGLAPAFEAWTINNQQTDFRIDKTDLDGTDRATELEGVVPDSVITVVQTDNVGLNTIYRVVGVVDLGTYMQYIVVLQSQGGSGPTAGSVTTINIEVPVPLATEYEEETDYFPAGNPSWGTVESSLEYDGVDQAAPNTTGYGIDVEFEPASISEDWDLISSA